MAITSLKDSTMMYFVMWVFLNSDRDSDVNNYDLATLISTTLVGMDKNSVSVDPFAAASSAQ